MICDKNGNKYYKVGLHLHTTRSDGLATPEEAVCLYRQNGYDALKGEYVDMVERGIIDPTQVTRSALQNAASIAAMILTTESLVADIPEPEPAAPAGGGMGGMY